MMKDVSSLVALLEDVPPDKLAQAVDSVLIDYSIVCVQDSQSDPTDEAISNILYIKRLRDALWELSTHCSTAQ